MGVIRHIFADRCIWKASILDGGLDRATEALHGECPWCPDRACCIDQIHNMKKCMYCDQAGGDSWRIMLVIKSIKVFSAQMWRSIDFLVLTVHISQPIAQILIARIQRPFSASQTEGMYEQAWPGQWNASNTYLQWTYFPGWQEQCIEARMTMHQLCTATCH